MHTRRECARLRGVSEGRLAVGVSAPLPDLRPCRLLRQLAKPCNQSTFTRPAIRNFFKILDRSFGLGIMAWPGGKFAVTHGVQLPAHRLGGDVNAELLKDPLAQIDEPPAHDAMDGRDWPILDHPRERRPVFVLEP
jgi:hypothetical protein